MPLSLLGGEEVHNAASLAPNNVVAATELVRVKSKTDTEKKSYQIASSYCVT